MGKKQVPGFLYIYSETIKQEVAMSYKTGRVYCEDKGPGGDLVSYSHEEILLIKESGGLIDPMVHRIKKIFGGEIVNYGNKQGPDNKREPVEKPEPNSITNDTNKSGTVPGAPGNGPEGEPELFDIY